jgi:hypothetical protein
MPLEAGGEYVDRSNPGMNDPSIHETARSLPAQGIKTKLFFTQPATSEIVLIFPVRDERHVSTNRSEVEMSYIYTVLASMGDAKKFGDAGASWAGDRLKSHGATSSTASQIIMGGEMSGMVIVAFEFDSVDAAMSGQSAIYQDADLVALMQDAQVQVQRRNLFRVQAERGTRTGQFGSVLYMAGSPVDDSTMDKNLDLNWSHIQNGANGITWMQSVASGPAPFSATVATWTDSLDSLMAASASNFADPAVQKIMAETKAQVLGRVLTRRLY